MAFSDSRHPEQIGGPDRSGDRLEIVVDQETGFPLRITESLDRQFLHEIRLTTLVADAPCAGVDVHHFVPGGCSGFRQDAGFRPVSPSEATRLVGYEPLIPTDAQRLRTCGNACRR